MGDADYLLAFQQVVMPVAYEFDPDLVISKAPVTCHSWLLTIFSCCRIRRRQR